MSRKPHDRPNALTDPNRQTDLDQMNTHLPSQAMQPEESSPRADQPRPRGRSDEGTERGQQSAGDDISEAPEET